MREKVGREPFGCEGAGRGSGKNVRTAWLLVTLLVAVTVPGSVHASTSADPGTELWVSRYNGPGNSFDGATSLAVSPDGATVFVTGESAGTDSSGDYATAAYSTANGTELWAARYGGSGYDYATSLAVSPDGATVFVTGYSEGTDSDYATVAYSAASGTELWVSRYNGSGNAADAAFALAVSPDGSRVFVTGWSYPDAFSVEYATIAYSSASGSELWVSHYNGPGTNSDDEASSIAVSPDGATVFVTGSSGSDRAADYATVAYSSASGAQLWVTEYDGPASSYDFATSIAVSQDGFKVFVTGRSQGSGSSYDYATVAYSSASGAELWVSRYNGAGNDFDGAYSLAVSPDGSTVFVTGSSRSISGGFYDYATVAYSAAAGTQVWVAQYDGPASEDDQASSLKVSPDGLTVFVTGSSYELGPASANYATVAYSTTSGAELWVTRYNGPGNSDDFARSLAVSPNGSTVFVTGFGDGADSSADYATVAYQAVKDGSNLFDRSKPILLVHGVDAIGRAGDDCNTTWNSMVSSLKSWGWSSTVRISYYIYDANCDDSIDSHGDHSKHQGGRSVHAIDKKRLWHHNADTPIEHLAYHLAWFIYDKFSSREQSVELVGYSMGGLIIRDMLAQFQLHDPDAPPKLLVEDVVTLGTPHAGASATTWCPLTYECKEMKPNSSSMQWWAAHAQNPQAAGGTDWTLIGSYGDQVVLADSAVGMKAHHRIKYESPDVNHTGQYNYMGWASDDRTAVVQFSANGGTWLELGGQPLPVRWSDFALATPDW